jgi:hypothetical protein
MGERGRFWVSIVLSALGGTLLAMLTLDPQQSVANFGGWLALVFPAPDTPRQPGVLPTLIALAGLVASVVGTIAAFARSAHHQRLADAKQAEMNQWLSDRLGGAPVRSDETNP